MITGVGTSVAFRDRRAGFVVGPTGVDSSVHAAAELAATEPAVDDIGFGSCGGRIFFFFFAGAGAGASACAGEDEVAVDCESTTSEASGNTWDRRRVEEEDERELDASRGVEVNDPSESSSASDGLRRPSASSCKLPSTSEESESGPRDKSGFLECDEDGTTLGEE